MTTKPTETNYITRKGALRMQEEIGELWTKRRKVVQEVADAAAQGDRSENAEYIYGKKKLREIDRRIHFLTKRLDVATVLDPAERPEGERERVFFGATVDLEDEDGKQATYQIVGADEIDLVRGCISYRSPLGRALLKRREGETILFKKPSGETELTILAIRYE
ncbi:Transcription elongation factor GreB [Labilithrix luteola]|uniref:Transcription elongation factor GreB n=1 Tax=Labilithrix luteola TaxID=1391654 RepID=A0A0K1QCI6_9BACT|nr:transcription elongation factor GreB [Labilithrix luteola]AKV03459.1 Transcription elongation factor GreB [Labilithrix luteola]